MNTPVVHTLISIPKEEHYDACTLCLSSLRVGFPTAKIVVWVNDTGPVPFARVLNDAEKCLGRSKNIASPDSRTPVFSSVGGNALIVPLEKKMHHAEWMRMVLSTAEDAGVPLVIVDPDCIFWENCENMQVPEGTLLAGHRVPTMWNDFAHCRSVARIHTSFMVMPEPDRLMRVLRDVYPWCFKPAGEYCPCDPFSPAVRFYVGEPVFWDTCANLYQMLIGCADESVYDFGPDEFKRYDHLNSASFFDVMLERLPDKEGFAYVHRFLSKPEDRHKLRGLTWDYVLKYYQACAEAVYSKGLSVVK